MMAFASSEIWEYDKAHPKGLDTLSGDNLKPAQSDIPVEKERSLSITSHKNEPCVFPVTLAPEEFGTDPTVVLERRRSSVSTTSHLPRKPTGSFGNLVESLKPLSSLTSAQKISAMESAANSPFS